MKEFSPPEVSSLLTALSDPSASVRLAALRALVRLPLTRQTWEFISPLVGLFLHLSVVNAKAQTPDPETLPLAEVIEAAIFVPTLPVRTVLRKLLTSDNPELRSMTAHALAKARDTAAEAQLISELSESSATRRLDAAKSLSLISSARTALSESGRISEALKDEADADVRFWLALTLAGQGDTSQIRQVLQGMRDQTIELKELFGDPSQFTGQLKKRGPFNEPVRDMFEQLAADHEDFVAEAASVLAQAGLPKTASASEESSAPPEEPRDPVLAESAAEVVREIEQAGELDPKLTHLLRPELLPYLPAGLDQRAVTLMFMDAIDNGEFGRSGNEIVLNVHRLGNRFQPELEPLFYCYLHAHQKPEVDTQWFLPWATRWQIAWTAARAGQEKLIREVSPWLKSEEEQERKLAAQFIEDSSLYIKQDFPPIFGGGSAPDDALPQFDLITTEPGPAKEAGSSDKDVYLGSVGDLIRGGRQADLEDSGIVIEKIGTDIDEKLSELNRGLWLSYSDATKEWTNSAEKSFTVDAADASPEQLVINTGFATRSQPDDKILPTLPLLVNQKYYFWIDRSLPDRKTSIEETRVDVPAVPDNALLTIAVFGFEDGIRIESGADVGEVKVIANSGFRVVSQPVRDFEQSLNRQSRLFFPVQMAEQAGMARMRCNIYWGQILLQSRLITAEVSDEAQPQPRTEKALRSVLDYNLSRELDPSHLKQLPAHRLSMLLNNNGDGTNSFHLMGGDGKQKFKQDDLRFREGELQGMIEQARGTLRTASWGNADEWQDKFAYRYRDGKKDFKRLSADLLNLAKWGYGFYTQIQARLAGKATAENPNPVKAFEDLMSTPGFVQIALKESPTYVLPAAMIYDYKLDTGAAAFSLCPNFENAFTQGEPLEALPCFNGNCASRGNLTVVCPSGFWGFRHYLGMPLSVENGPAVPVSIDVRENLRMAAGVATNLGLVAPHTAIMSKLRSGMGWDYADNRSLVFAALKKSPHVVYFYCHGGLVRNAPFLQVGTSDQILTSNFYAYEIVWDSPRPLVFINGCHTTAVAPQQALEFISPLVSYSHSAGVVGTEITIFEELATAFAEECFRRFYSGESIGEAIRNTRLKLLAGGNPLGLVYIPFVMAGLKLNYLN